MTGSLGAPMRMAPELYAQMIEHARSEAPNECCGMIGSRGGQVVKLYPAANAADSPRYRFEIAGQELYNVLSEIEEESELGGIYHSHPRTAPEPSLTDIKYAELWPDLTWIIVGFAEHEPDVRAWRIEDGEVTEAELVVG